MGSKEARMKDAYIVVGVPNLASQQKLNNYIYLKTGHTLNFGPIQYNGKLSILRLRADLTSFSYTNITCAPYAGKYKFNSVDKFIDWYETNQSMFLDVNN